MNIDPERQADILRALALGELSEDDPRAREILDACEETRAEWRELSRAIRELEQAGGEDEEVARNACLDIRDEDLARARAFYLPRLRPAVVRRRRVQLTWALPAAVATCALLVWASGTLRRPEAPGLGTPGAPSLMGEAAEGLTLSARVEPDGEVRLEWEHDEGTPRIPGTVYEVELILPGDADPIRVSGVDDARWSRRVQAAPGSRILCRVTAFSGEEDYAHGEDVLVLPE